MAISLDELNKYTKQFVEPLTRKMIEKAIDKGDVVFKMTRKPENPAPEQSQIETEGEKEVFGKGWFEGVLREQQKRRETDEANRLALEQGERFANAKSGVNLVIAKIDKLNEILSRQNLTAVQANRASRRLREWMDLAVKNDELKEGPMLENYIERAMALVLAETNIDYEAQLVPTNPPNSVLESYKEVMSGIGVIPPGTFLYDPSKATPPGTPLFEREDAKDDDATATRNDDGYVTVVEKIDPRVAYPIQVRMYPWLKQNAKESQWDTVGPVEEAKVYAVELPDNVGASSEVVAAEFWKNWKGNVVDGKNVKLQPMENVNTVAEGPAMTFTQPSSEMNGAELRTLLSVMSRLMSDPQAHGFTPEDGEAVRKFMTSPVAVEKELQELKQGPPEDRIFPGLRRVMVDAGLADASFPEITDRAIVDIDSALKYVVGQIKELDAQKKSLDADYKSLAPLDNSSKLKQMRDYDYKVKARKLMYSAGALRLCYQALRGAQSREEGRKLDLMLNEMDTMQTKDCLMFVCGKLGELVAWVERERISFNRVMQVFQNTITSDEYRKSLAVSDKGRQEVLEFSEAHFRVTDFVDKDILAIYECLGSMADAYNRAMKKG